jgi:hypothetical protein
MDSCENWGFWFDKLSSKFERSRRRGGKINSAGFIDQTPAILHSSEGGGDGWNGSVKRGGGSRLIM